MKKLLLSLFLLLISSQSYALPGNPHGYIFTDIPLTGTEYWIKTTDNNWHVYRGSLFGLKGTYDITRYFQFIISDGLIVDAVGYSDTTESHIGIVGNSLELGLCFTDPLNTNTIKLSYGFKHWWVNSEKYGYEYLVARDSAVQTLNIKIELRLF